MLVRRALVIAAALGCAAFTPLERDPVERVPDPTSLDAFGVRMLHRTKPGGRTWAATFGRPRTLAKGKTDPLDAEFQNRGDATFAFDADGAATASGSVLRHYIWDQTRNKKWRDVEITFYAMRVSESAPKSTSGFIVEVRTDDGHVDDPARQCLGASYAMAMYYDGRAAFKKEAKHPVYSANNPTAQIWGGGPLPANRWIGFKAIVKDVAGGVMLELWRDLTHGLRGGSWERVLAYTDKGGWRVGDGSPICGKPADRILSGAFPVVLLRNDGATMRYEKLSVREID